MKDPTFWAAIGAFACSLLGIVWPSAAHLPPRAKSALRAIGAFLLLISVYLNAIFSVRHGGLSVPEWFLCKWGWISGGACAAALSLSLPPPIAPPSPSPSVRPTPNPTEISSPSAKASPVGTASAPTVPVGRWSGSLSCLGGKYQLSLDLRQDGFCADGRVRMAGNLRYYPMNAGAPNVVATMSGSYDPLVRKLKVEMASYRLDPIYPVVDLVGSLEGAPASLIGIAYYAGDRCGDWRLQTGDVPAQPMTPSPKLTPTVGGLSNFPFARGACGL